MRGHKREDARGNKKNVSHEKSRDGKRAHLRAAAHESLNTSPNPGNFVGGIRSYSSSKISLLVPREQVTGERHSQDEPEKHESGKPEQLAPTFVRSVDVGL